MAEESGASLGSLAGLIPSLYFDVIARVCPGALMVLWAVSLTRSQPLGTSKTIVAFLGAVDGVKSAVGTSGAIVAFLGASYIAGLICTPLYALISSVVEIVYRRIHRTRGYSVHLVDAIALKNPGAGVILSKMRAEAFLAGGVLVAAALFWVSYSSLNWQSLLVFLFLIESAVHRNVVFIARTYRFCTLLGINVSDPVVHSKAEHKSQEPRTGGHG